MQITHAALLAASLALTGCATSYGSSGITGGHFESKVNDRLIKVNFSGNGYITADKVQTYALYRCAEMALEAKKPHFVIYESLFAAASDAPSAQPRVGTMGGKPTAIAFMLLEDQPRPGSHETRATLDKLAPIVQPPPESGKVQ